MFKDPLPPLSEPKPRRKAAKMPQSYGSKKENMPKSYPQRKLKPAVKDEMGIMGSSMEQAKQRKEKMLADMRKRKMLRQKQGQ